MFKTIHRTARHYVSDLIDIYYDIHGYDTTDVGSLKVYLKLSTKRYTEFFFFYIRVQNMEWSA